jgi:osmotically inducible protein OsmC
MNSAGRKFSFTATTRGIRTLYTTEATMTGGREGYGRTADGRLDVTLSIPEEMSGPGGPGTNPEQLFATAYVACFQSAMMFEARQQRIMADDSTVTARVGIGPVEDRYRLAVDLAIHLPSVPDRAKAEELVEAAHRRCPYSNAIRGNIDMNLAVR